ncbi:MAG: tRNA-dihydrouridine synthase family protein [Candidatus Aenigmarchaeota archaeon]|nr:tRNA-dihydrouridine synthase family protein [Candidatus Aenigmarchaeota archaeon]
MRKLKIGDVKLKNRLLLSPLVDVSDLPFRLVCRKAGAAMAYIEMLNISAILHENRHTEGLMRTDKRDKPSGIQITGRTVEEFEKVVPYVENFDVVDINCGCPSIRITDNGSGSFLLKHPEKIADMVRTLKDAGLTTTAKIRLGFKENNVLKVAKAVEKAGADAITVHARLADHGSDVPADWKWIAKVKHTVGIPVIGNGDVWDGPGAEKMLDLADGAMIARASIGDPAVFERILHYLKTGKEKEFDARKNMKIFLEYLSLEKTNGADMGRIKRVCSKFVRGFGGAAKARDEMMKKKTYDGVLSFAKELRKSV